MDPMQIYVKTPLGSEEIKNCKLHLAPRLRTMLIMVDGRKSVAALKNDAAKFSCPIDFIESLLAAGLIVKAVAAERAASSVAASTTGVQSVMPTEAPPALDGYEKLRLAKDFMNNAVVNSLGMKGFFFTLKLERAGNVADLRGLVKPFQDAITKASGEAEAKILTEQLLKYLG